MATTWGLRRGLLDGGGDDGEEVAFVFQEKHAEGSAAATIFTRELERRQLSDTTTIIIIITIVVIGILWQRNEEESGKDCEV